MSTRLLRIVTHKWKEIFWFLAIMLWSCALAYMVCMVSRPVFRDFFKPLIFFLSLFGAVYCFERLKGKISWIISRSCSLLILLLTPLVIISYIFYNKQKRTMAFEDIYALLQSDRTEITFYSLHNFFSTKSITIAITGAVCTLIILYAGITLAKKKSKGQIRYLLASLLLLGTGAFISSQLYPVQFSIKVYNQYFEDIATFKTFTQQLSLASQNACTKKESGELYILIIGESQSRDFMSSYSGPITQNTPWMDTVKKDPSWFILPNAYSTHTHTEQVLSASLTDGRYLTGLTFPKGATLLQSLKAAKIRTHWLSNQAALGPWDSRVSALAHQADTPTFINKNSHSFALAVPQPDECLIPLFKETLRQSNPDDNIFIVIHLMGNHGPYSARYPKDFPVQRRASTGEAGKQSNNPDRMDKFIEYTTSIAYTDSVLKKLHEAIKNEQRPTAFLFFADHGEDIFSRDGGHDFQQFTWHKARIPMCIWLSESYQARYPERADTLRRHVDRVFTNDLIFDLLLGLMNIKNSSLINSLYDLSHSDYSVTMENAIIAGKKKISEDPFLQAQNNVSLDKEKYFALHRANTAFKANQGLRLGVTGLEIDLLFTERNGKKQLLLGHDQASITGLTIQEYLSALVHKPDFLWLDIKNMTVQNTDKIRKELDELDRQFSLKGITLIESGNAAALEGFSKNGWRCSFYLPWQAIQNAVANNDFSILLQVSNQVKQHNITAVSFDLVSEKDIMGKLLPLLPEKTLVYGRSLDHSWGEQNMPLNIPSRAQYEKILVPLETAYDY